MTQKTPLIVVLGATACGKSKLAIELAKKFNGEIISADSMQVYKGLDIITNKVTKEEQQSATHHMINFLHPSARYSVIDFRNTSLEIINNLHKNHQLPIIVGGTNYYIESLLWKSFLLGPTLESAKRDFEELTDIIPDKTLIDSEIKILKDLDEGSLHTVEDLESVDKFFSKPIYNDGFSKFDNQKLWDLLESVDPISAHLFHPNDRRRVIRSLQVKQANKRNFSEILKDVNKSDDNDRASLGGPLRYKATLVIWLNCDKSILDKVVDERVEKMLDMGLIAELESFHDNYNKMRLVEREKLEYDKGIFQTIGFKEFHDYLLLDSTTKTSDVGKKILQQSIERMKLSTRQYSRKQLKWIRRRFLKSGSRDLPVLFELKTNFDEAGWIENVQKPAFRIVSTFIEGRNHEDDLMKFKRQPEDQEIKNNPGKFYCKACERTLIGSYYIESHLNSKAHKLKSKPT